MTMQRHLKLYKLPEETKTPGLRRLKATDIPDTCKLLNEVRFYLHCNLFSLLIPRR